MPSFDAGDGGLVGIVEFGNHSAGVKAVAVDGDGVGLVALFAVVEQVGVGESGGEGVEFGDVHWWAFLVGLATIEQVY